MTSYFFLRYLHILATSIWFGATLLLSGDIRRSLAAGNSHGKLLIDRVNRTVAITSLTGILTLLSGVAMVLQSGGFANLPFRLLFGFCLTILLLALGILGMRPLWARMRQLITNGHDDAELRSLSKAITTLSGISHLLWVTILGLMVFKNALT